MKLLKKLIDGILWLIRPHLVRVDRDTAEYLTRYGGAKLVK